MFISLATLSTVVSLGVTAQSSTPSPTSNGPSPTSISPSSEPSFDVGYGGVWKDANITYPGTGINPSGVAFVFPKAGNWWGMVELKGSNGSEGYSMGASDWVAMWTWPNDSPDRELDIALLNTNLTINGTYEKMSWKQPVQKTWDELKWPNNQYFTIRDIYTRTAPTDGWYLAMGTNFDTANYSIYAVSELFATKLETDGPSGINDPSMPVYEKSSAGNISARLVFIFAGISLAMAI